MGVLSLSPKRITSIYGTRAVDDYNYAAEVTVIAAWAIPRYHWRRDTTRLYFPASGPPTALLGFENRNLYLDDQGAWKVPFIPAYILRYPFILGGVENANRVPWRSCSMNRPPTSAAGDGEPLFDENGNPSELLQERRELLNKMQREYIKTEQLTKALFDAGVLVERQLTRGAEKKTILSAFYVINEDRLQALPDETILEWRGNGILQIVYAHLLSLHSLNELLDSIGG